jgi:uncharacterized cupin superfamily protein
MAHPSFTRLNVHTAPHSPFPEFNGTEAVLYSPPDGTGFAASFHLAGKHDMVMQYDDFFFVIAGSARITLDGTDAFDLVAGDFCHLRKGTAVAWDLSEDFHEVSVLVSDEPFDHLSHE